MICYRDMTFCPFWEECQEGAGCFRALTKAVQEDAEVWWGKPEPPVSVYGEKPECFKEDT